ncbi:MAG: septal ring lytic transglycosylase RlpA family protein [Burkholderiaceae bacterium]|nr:septal ring lytic transglycosylase RlpA family protein [Burkholderiaceae bacterium]
MRRFHPPATAWPALLIVLAWLAGCASSPPATRSTWPTDPGRDGPGTNPPPDLLAVPDAEPRVEPVRAGGPNKPYAVLGQTYTPLAGDPPLVERGLASWYGNKFHGRGTANGETYNMYAMTAAHKTMPLPSYARVRNPANGREVVVRVNDRGPFHGDRVIDLSYTAALKLGLLGGVAPVEVERITYEAIRTGAWRAPAGSGVVMAQGLPQTGGLGLPDPAAPMAEPAADPIGEIARRTMALPAPAAPAPPAAAPAAAPYVVPAAAAVAARAAAKSAPGFWLQLGAFTRHDGAVAYQQRVAQEADWLAPLLAVFNERKLHRLQAGPYASRADALSAASRLRETLQLVPAVVERK